MHKKYLLSAATKARALAYAPDSNSAVGAALLTKTGGVVVGCNVGERVFSINNMCGAKQPAIPCEACRQVLAEFNPTMKVIAVTPTGELQEFELTGLLPLPTQGILEARARV